MPSLVVIDHPLVQVKLGLLRDQGHALAGFPPRAARVRRADVLTSATADVPTVPITVQTPLAPCPAVALARPLVLAPILRAGLGLLEGVFDLVADAQIAHLGMYRDEATLKPVTYYAKVPAEHRRLGSHPARPHAGDRPQRRRRGHGAATGGRAARPASCVW